MTPVKKQSQMLVAQPDTIAVYTGWQWRHYVYNCKRRHVGVIFVAAA